MKFGEWSDYCLPLVKSRMKANTYHNNYEIPLYHHLQPYFGEWELREIKTSTVQRFVDIKGERYAKETIKKMTGCMSLLMDFAIDEGLADRNPVTRRIYIRSAVPPQVKRVWTQEQYDKAWTFARYRLDAAHIVHAFYIKIPMYKVADMFDDPDFTRLFHERPEEIRDKEVADPDLLDDDQITETDIDAAYDFFLHGAYMNFLFPRLLYLLFSIVCLYGIWNSIWGGDLLPFGLPCPAFLRFLLTAPVSMIPLAILLVGEGVSLWIVPLLPDKEKPASR